MQSVQSDLESCLILLKEMRTWLRLHTTRFEDGDPDLAAMHGSDWEVKVVGGLTTSDEPGTFTGYAATYGGPPDAQGDVIERGAFSLSLRRRSKYPILWGHDVNAPVGYAEVEDGPRGLRVVGRLNLAVQKAKEAYALLRDGTIRGLSIGYNVLKSHYVGSARHLTEIALMEVSLTGFPANEFAMVEAVKTGAVGDEEIARFVYSLQQMRADAKRWGGASENETDAERART